MHEFRNVNELPVLRKNDINKNNCKNVFDLENIKNTETIRVLINQLLMEKSRTIEELILKSLIKIRDKNFADLVMGLLKSDDAFLRDAGKELLSVCGNSALEIFKKVFADLEKDISLTISNTFRNEQWRDVAAILGEVIENDKEENIVAAAVEYLGLIGKSEKDKNVIKQALNRFSSPFFKYISGIALKNLDYYNEVNK
ncbi:HEAT repeat domain-containing protein [Thermoanaerobacterium thermosaccharolyticum]|uniref:HEAT repeat domain-containing protein n=1 Tax=Thermoanaerobacterium thermosaccharolyticum TaxID=1517 RepID=UPI0020A42844|nr:HEAT repeat domain-containing protein [Thermoanaerobacterium thermosaccharolyticum]MCP2238987.1 hypothetical protein [Thermoanaerobacterium thermosaccharolyticum]